MNDERLRLMPSNRRGHRTPSVIDPTLRFDHASLIFVVLWACLSVTAVVSVVMSAESGNLIAAYLNGCFLLTAVTASVCIRAMPKQPGLHSFLLGVSFYFASLVALFIYGGMQPTPEQQGMWVYPTWQNTNFLILFYFCMPPFMLGASLLSHALKTEKDGVR